jgi:HME family heavy-metal exporter
VRISKIPNVNTLELTKTIEQKITEIGISLPKNVQLYDGLFKQSWFIEKGLENVESAFIDAAIIVGIVVILFLMNVRTVMVTLISLPITLLLTAIVFKISGIGINIMTLGGLTIAIGELVDDAIVDMENIYRRLSENA